MKPVRRWEKDLDKGYIVSIVFVAIILIILSFFGEFIQSINEDIRAETEVSLSEHTAYSINIIHNKIEDTFSTVEALAAFIGKYDNIADVQVMDLLKQQSINSRFTRMAVTTPDGISYTDDGVIHETADREYFQKAMKGEKNVSNIIISRADGSEVIVFAVPIYREGVIVGVLRSTTNIAMFESLLNVPTYEGQEKSYIIQTDGTIITKMPGLEQTNNYFDLLQNAKMQDSGYLQKFRDDMQNERGGTLRYICRDIPYYVNYVPIGINQWYLLAIVPSEVMQAKASNISKLVISLMVKELFALIFLFFYILYLQRKQLRTIHQSNQKLEALTSNIPGGVFRYTADEKEVMHFVSDGLLKIFGYTEKEFREEIGNVFSNMIYEEDRKSVLAELEMQSQTSHVNQVEYRIVSAWGEIRWVTHGGQLVIDPKGKEWFYVLVTDITDTKKTQENLRLNEERYRIVAESSSSILFECDAKDKTVTFLSRATEKYGYKPKVENFPQGFVDEKIIHEDDVSDFYEYCLSTNNGEFSKPIEVRCLQKDGSYRWCTLQMTPIFDDEHVLIKGIGRITDIDVAKKETELLREQSKRDPLTGLYNKVHTEVIIDSYLKAEGKGKTHALLFIDIDNFKAVNDNLGHLFGDSVLKGMSSRVKQLFYGSDIAGRVGGDEFVILLKEVESKEIIIKKAEAICNIFKNAFTGDHKELKISGSIGISIYKKDGTNYLDLFEKADIALYHAKKLGKDRYQFYWDDMSK